MKKLPLAVRRFQTVRRLVPLMIIAVICLPLMAVVNSCIKPKSPPPRYTISGTLLMAPDQKVPTPKRMGWEVLAIDEGAGWDGKNEILGYFSPDEQGNFSFTYEETDIDGPSARIDLHSDPPAYYEIRDLLVNQNVEDTFYTRGPAFGTLRIYLKPLKPLDGDTLFVGYGIEKGLDLVLEIDTFLTDFEGLWLELRLPPPQKTLHYGRGHTEFYYDTFYDELRWSKHVNAQVKGDPVVNEVTIEY